MKIIDCEFHYYLPELMDYLATRDEAMRYYPETSSSPAVEELPEKESVYFARKSKMAAHTLHQR